MGRPSPEVIDLAPVLLVVGSPLPCGRPGAAPIEGVHFCRFAEVDDLVLRRFLPDLVVSPLWGADFDAQDLVERLAALGFTGRYRALTGDLPDRALVLADLRRAAPGLDIGLFEASELRGAPR